jgi:hypothetical protein
VVVISPYNEIIPRLPQSVKSDLDGGDKVTPAEELGACRSIGSQTRAAVAEAASFGDEHLAGTRRRSFLTIDGFHGLFVVALAGCGADR